MPHLRPDEGFPLAFRDDRGTPVSSGVVHLRLTGMGRGVKSGKEPAPEEVVLIDREIPHRRDALSEKEMVAIEIKGTGQMGYLDIFHAKAI